MPCYAIFTQVASALPANTACRISWCIQASDVTSLQIHICKLEGNSLVKKKSAKLLTSTVCLLDAYLKEHSKKQRFEIKYQSFDVTHLYVAFGEYIFDSTEDQSQLLTILNRYICMYV